MTERCDERFSPTQTDFQAVCRLDAGHEGPHRDEFTDRHVRCVVTWEPAP